MMMMPMDGGSASSNNSSTTTTTTTTTTTSGRKRRNNGSIDLTDDNDVTVANLDEIQFPWRVGSVKGIYMSDFLTYHQNVKVDFGTRVNLVIGPNGNGKSSIVCAIMIGLNGKIKALDRGDDITSFIRNKETHDETEVPQATLMIELVGSKDHGEHRRVFIKCVISREKKTSIFYMNRNAFEEMNILNVWNEKKGEKKHEFVNADKTKENIIMKKVNKGEVTNLVRDIFHIDLGNVCQFLPQQAVRDFTNCNSKELLRRTVESILGKDMIEEQQELARTQEARSTENLELENLEDNLGNKQREADSLEEKIDTVKRIQADRKRLELMKMKVGWLRFFGCRNELGRTKEDMKKLEEQLVALKKELEPQEKTLKKEEKALKYIEKKKQEPLTKQKNQSKAQLKRLKDRIQRANDKFEDTKNDIENLETKRNQRNTKMQQYKQAIEEKKIELSGLDDLNELQGNVNNIEKQRRALNHKVSSEEQKIEDLQDQIQNIERDINKHKRTMDQIKNVNNEKLKKCFQQDRSGGNVKRAFDILRNLKRENKLHGVVNGPLAAEITCTGRPDVLENIIGRRYINAFIFTDRRDVNLLFRINKPVADKITYIMTPEIITPDHPFNPTNINGVSLKFADQLLIEPKREILSALCGNTGIANTLIGDENAQKEVDNQNRPLIHVISQRYGGNKGFVLFTDKFRHQVRYNNLFRGTTAEQSKQFGSRYDNFGLTKRVDKERYNAEKRSMMQKAQQIEGLKSQIASINETIAPITKQRAKLIIELEGFKGKIKARRKLEQRIAKWERQIEDLVGRDFDKEIAELKVNMVKFSDEQVKLLQKWVTYYKDEYMPKIEEFGAVQLDYQCRKMHIADLKDAYEVSKVAYDDVKRRRDVCYERLIELRARAKRLLAKAKEVLENEQDAPEGYNEITNSLDELEGMIGSLELTLSRERSNPQQEKYMIEKYEKLNEEIAELTNQRNEYEHKQSAAEQEYIQQKDAWVQKVEDLVQKISIKFKANMHGIGHEGDVELKKTDQIKDYGVYMRVSYLPGQRVTQLNHSQHSGGEKRVATIMYLLALQKLNPSCPLRIVDEINQGMDAKNERKAFAALVENVCGKQNDERARRSGSQFFVITPKLLPNFEYRPEVTVLTVCKAKSMISSKGWDLDAFIRKKKQKTRVT